jgi:hypothetical protein
MNATRPIASVLLSAALLAPLAGCSNAGPLGPLPTTTAAGDFSNHAWNVLPPPDDRGPPIPIPLPPAKPTDPGDNDRESR